MKQIVGSFTRALMLAAIAVVSIRCAPSDQILVRFRSDAVQKSVNEMRVFVLAADPARARDGPPPCSLLDPRGLGPGDAEARTGLVAIQRWKGANQSTLGELKNLKKGQYTIVIEGWGPPCKPERVVLPARREDDPTCAETDPKGQAVLRAYYCGIHTLDPSHKLDAIVSLQTFAKLGSQIVVPHLAQVYDARNPLLVVDGLESHNVIYAQLLDETSGGIDGAKMRWSVVSGSAAFDFLQPVLTDYLTPEETPNPQHGVGSAVLHAGIGASSVDGGKIVIAAYAPGFDGAPLLFEARALRGVDIELEAVALPKNRVDLDGASFEYQPVAVDDLNGDGLLDIATIGAVPGRCSGDGTMVMNASHQLAILFGAADGSVVPAFSAPMAGEVTAVGTARLDKSGRRALLASSRDFCPGRMQQTPMGVAYVVKSPRIEVWQNLAPSGSDGMLAAEPLVLTEVQKCNGAQCAPAPITKNTIAFDAADIDEDGVDELAMSRCSYVRRASGGQVSDPRRAWYLDVNCHGLMNDLSDSEVAVFTAELSGTRFTGLKERAAVQNRGLDGGFREVRFADVNGDGSLDLVFATDTQVAGYFGRKNMPESGFGFATASRFEVSASFSHVFSLGTGHFNAPQYADALIGGGYRLSSSIAGLKLLVWNAGNSSVESGPTTIAVGPPTDGRLLLVRVADLNGDQRADALVLHRETRELQIYFGGGTKLLAAGPTIAIPAGLTGELDVRVESPGDRQTAIAAISAPQDNVVFIARIRPQPR